MSRKTEAAIKVATLVLFLAFVVLATVNPGF